MISYFRRLTLALGMIFPLSISPTVGHEFRFSFQSDVASLDPHFFDHAFTQGILSNVYEGLTRWDNSLNLSPALATAWAQQDPLTWIFHLRRDVIFHAGQTFTADDVVFSFERAMSPDSGYAGLTAPIARIEKIDEFSIRFVLHRPYAILPRMTTNIMIMSRSWAEQHGATASSSIRTGTRNFASLNANGTGPFRISSYEPETMLRFQAFEGWWDKPEHNLTTATFRPIGNAATRVAALLSRQMDMIWPVPLADIPRVQTTPGMRAMVRASEWAVMIRLNVAPVAADQPPNPFADVRVREAVYRAIDTDAIRSRVMRGLSLSTGLPLAPNTVGHVPELDVRLDHDIARARALLAEAGFGDGLSFTLDCPTDRFINDEAICRALVAMFARVGISARLEGRRTAAHFGHLQRMQSQAFMVGWASAGVKDAHNLLSMLFATRSGNRGAVNYAGYTNTELDRLIDKIGGESDASVRSKDFEEAFRIIRNDIAVIPLHIQPSAWGVTEGFEMLHLPDDNVRLWQTRFVTSNARR